MKLDLKKATAAWVEQGLIEAEQAEAILEYERSEGKSRWTRVGLYGFLILGGGVMSVGVISLVAANWEAIPAAVKLAVDFLLLAALGAGIYWSQLKGKTILFDLLGTIFVLWCLATIGLISQVFHTGGKLHQALAFWLLITFPLVTMGKKRFLPALWSVGAMVSFNVWAFTEDSWWAQHFLADGEYIDGDNIFPHFMIVATACIGLAGACSKLPALSRHAGNFMFWGLCASLVALGAGDIFWSIQEKLDPFTLYPAFVLLPLALVALAARRDMSGAGRVLLAMLLCLSLLVYIPGAMFSDAMQSRSMLEHKVMFQLAGAASSITGGLLLALYFIVRRRAALFHTMTVLVALRFLIIYFQVFENLAYTGAGLVAFGLVLMGLAVAWYRSRARLEGLARRLAP